MSESETGSESESEIIQGLLFIVHEKEIEGKKSDHWSTENEFGDYFLLPLIVRNFSRPKVVQYVLQNDIEILTSGREYPDLKADIEMKLVEIAEVLLDCEVQYDWYDNESIDVWVDEANEKMARGTFFSKFAVRCESLSSKRNFKWTTDADTVSVLEKLLGHVADIPLKHSEEGCLLHLAARRGDTTLATMLLDKGATIDARTNQGRTPLNIAADLGHAEIVTLLLNRGAKVDVREANGLMPLHAAAWKGHLNVSQILLQYGANVNAAISATSILRGATPLHLAIVGGNPEIVELFLANAADVHASGYFNGSSLQIAVAKGCAQMVSLVLDHGVDITDPKNKTAFLTAVCGNANDWKSIVEKMQQSGFSFNAEDACDSRLLHGAVRHNCLTTAKKLLDLGADVNGVSSANASRKTPLHVASEHGTDDMIVFLLQNGADLNAVCHRGKTPLFYAAEAGRMTAADVLLKSGANLKTRDNRSETVLSCVCVRDLPEMAKLLLKNGADANERTPIISAAKLGLYKVVEVLCQIAQVDITGSQNRTALHEAAKLGLCNTVKILIRNGCDINIQGDLDGRTPLFDAVMEEKLQVVNILLAFGARLNVFNKNGETVLQVAAKGKCQIFEYLLDYCFPSTELFNGPNVRNVPWPYNRRIKNVKFMVILKNHLIKMKMFDFDVDIDRTLSVWCHDFPWYFYLPMYSAESFKSKLSRKACKKELVSLKDTYVGSTQVSFYDFVLVDPRQLARYLRNESFAQALKSDFKLTFPIFGKIIEYQHRRGQQRLQLMDQSVTISLNLFKECGILAIELVQNILSYLNDREILILINVCSGTK